METGFGHSEFEMMLLTLSFMSHFCLNPGKIILNPHCLADNPAGLNRHITIHYHFPENFQCDRDFVESNNVLSGNIKNVSQQKEHVRRDNNLYTRVIS